MKKILPGSLAVVSIMCLTAFKLIMPQKVNIVFIGDSITYGQNSNDLQPGLYAVSYLKSKFNTTTFQQRNRGVNGHTTLSFLPRQADFEKVIKDADSFYADASAQLVFSVMLGTNDSAVKGTYGAPVSPEQYLTNLKTIADTLLKRYPKSKIVFNYPIYYSPNTYNGAMYLQEGLNRLQSYFPQIALLVKNYAEAKPQHVFTGYTRGFNDFKGHYTEWLRPEEGNQGTFYLHPNAGGAAYLGRQWGKAIAKAIDN